MKIKIVSDGNVFNTQVLNADTGEEIEGVCSIKIGEITVDSCIVKADIGFIDVPIEIVAEVEDPPDGH